MPEMTERQAKAWPEAAAVLNRAVESDVISVDFHHYGWTLVWADEIRPGRGHDLDARWNDGEYFAQILLDVYGYYSTSIASLDWIHTPSEECDCPSCEADREAEEAASESVYSGTVHWAGDAPTSLHGNGASSFDRTTRDSDEVTCGLCRTLLARPEPVDSGSEAERG